MNAAKPLERRKPRERGILFSAPMVLRLLDGSKTQTRRTIKDQVLASDGSTFEGSPYGDVGDRLWVRETWCSIEQDLKTARAKLEDAYSTKPIVFAADVSTDLLLGWRWRPSIFMPRWASRITLEIERIRVERVQEISEEDVRAEGCTPIAATQTIVTSGKLTNNSRSAAEAFSDLWITINGIESWTSNPWVWVLDFKPIKVRR